MTAMTTDMPGAAGTGIRPRITGLTAYGYHENAYRFSDEENFEDLRARDDEQLVVKLSYRFEL